MSHTYKESRVARAGARRLVVLDPLKFRGDILTELEAGDHIQVTVLNANGTVLQGTTDATYGVIFTQENGVTISAWSALVNCGFTAQTLKVIWDVQIGSAHEQYLDSIDVLASGLADRAYEVAADAEVA